MKVAVVVVIVVLIDESMCGTTSVYCAHFQNSAVEHVFCGTLKMNFYNLPSVVFDTATFEESHRAVSRRR